MLRAKIIDRWIELERQTQTDYDNDTRFDDFNYLRQYVLTNYPKIMGIIFGRLLKIDEIEKELDHYKSVTKEAKRVLTKVSSRQRKQTPRRGGGASFQILIKILSTIRLGTYL
ncbi:hypothetical protein [Bartonella harrusi]|uniref:hypothetical protein n=1 Tax=Bartonella harrusi TaxID=2961895 RepID=UPI0035A8BA9E